VGVGCLLLAAAFCAACGKKDTAAEPPAHSAAPARDGLIRVGEPAPDFEAVAHSGQRLKLSELRGKKVVLYFYPKDDTHGCTIEAEGFRDGFADLQKADVVVLGVSTDDNDSHREFAEKYKLPFLLLPDTEHQIAEAYGVPVTLGFTKRVTYLIDRQGKVAQIFPSVDPKVHADEILAEVSKLP
jgi:thioredoxin-dependent peroxiredoxin